MKRGDRGGKAWNQKTPPSKEFEVYQEDAQTELLRKFGCGHLKGKKMRDTKGRERSTNATSRSHWCHAHEDPHIAETRAGEKQQA